MRGRASAALVVWCFCRQRVLSSTRSAARASAAGEAATRGAGWRVLRVARCVLCVARCLSCMLRAVLRASLCGPSLFSAGQVRPHRPRCMLHLSMRCSATCNMKGCMLHKPIMLHVASQHAVQRNMQHERYDASRHAERIMPHAAVPPSARLTATTSQTTSRSSPTSAARSSTRVRADAS